MCNMLHSTAADIYLNGLFQDERNQVIVTNIWFRQYWKDYILTWNSSQYQGVNELHLTRNEVWVPDITLYNR